MRPGFWYTPGMQFSVRSPGRFHRYIFDWWTEHKRDLPWRHTGDPYRIFISEVMLQQTQVLRALPKYAEFLSLFPTVHDLSRASVSQVLRTWKGMGYNRRALYLREAARQIESEYKGIFPRDEKLLLMLPGVGQYTARAVLVFAYRQDIAMVDTNIRKIITHFFFRDNPQPERCIRETAEKLVPPGKSWEWHQALMDYGALELSKIRIKIAGNQTVPVKNKIPFIRTNRFLRGKIIDLLRDRDYKVRELERTAAKLFGRTEEQVREQLGKLRTEKLIHITRAGFAGLPD